MRPGISAGIVRHFLVPLVERSKDLSLRAKMEFLQKAESGH